MTELKVLQEDLNGLGWTIKSLMDENLKRPEVYESIKKIKGILVVTEADADVTVSLIFDRGDLSICNGAKARPSARLSGSFLNLSEVISGEVGPIRALLTGKIKARGNLLKLLKMAKALIG